MESLTRGQPGARGCWEGHRRAWWHDARRASQPGWRCWKSATNAKSVGRWEAGWDLETTCCELVTGRRLSEEITLTRVGTASFLCAVKRSAVRCAVSGLLVECRSKWLWVGLVGDGRPDSHLQAAERQKQRLYRAVRFAHCPEAEGSMRLAWWLRWTETAASPHQ
jgi:hypothetical protein